MATELIDARSVVTLASFITFIGIVVWAYSARRRTDFEEAARLPFADGNDADVVETERRHG